MYHMYLRLIRYAPSQSGDDLDQLEKGLTDNRTGRDNGEKEVQLGSAESSPDSTPEKSGGPIGRK